MTPTPRDCTVCGKRFNANDAGTWLRVEGWAIVRATGGYNVRDQIPTGPVLCPQCGREAELGVMRGQQGLPL